MAAHRPERRLAPVQVIMEWLGRVAAQCASNAEPGSLKGAMRLMASELSLAYPESAFSEESAKAVAMGFQFGWPTVVQMRKALDGWRKERGAVDSSARVLMSADRLSDPRVKAMELEERSWVAFWDRRIAEITAGDDPLWDDSDPDIRMRSKRAALAGTIRRYGGEAVVAVCARPIGQVHETPEFEFLRKRYENLEPKSDGPVDPRRAPRAGDEDLL